MALYNKIGLTYDSTRRADPFITQELSRLAQISEGHYLDLACGSGNYSVALSALRGTWHGVDQSDVMIETAKRKSTEVQWRVSPAEELPYPDGSFDGVICTLAIHHFIDLSKVFSEVARILQGRLVIFTSTPQQMQNYWLKEYFPDALAASASQMPTSDKLEEALAKNRLQILKIIPYSVQPDLQDLFLYSGKHHPEFYLQERIRSGISTFASLASSAEVKSGCARLKLDMESGRIHEIIGRSAEHASLGDYCFVVADSGV